MRLLLFASAALAVIGIAYWAYNENYQTQDALRRVGDLQRLIGEKREEMSVLRAEWAYLNRPDRLRDLVEINAGSLGLMPLSPTHFGTVEQVAFPRLSPSEIERPLDVSAGDDTQTPEISE
ncbi:MAG: cell division protein FtsL [Paracoccaceae bacterium]